jgi:hypothetical protein
VGAAIPRWGYFSRGLADRVGALFLLLALLAGLGFLVLLLLLHDVGQLGVVSLDPVGVDVVAFIVDN